jgi:hypothetical protein
MDVLKLIKMAKELGEGVKGSPALLALLTRVMLVSAHVGRLSGHPSFEIEDGKIDGVALDDVESALMNAGLSCHHQLMHHYRAPSTLALFLDPQEEMKEVS